MRKLLLLLCSCGLRKNVIAPHQPSGIAQNIYIHKSVQTLSRPSKVYILPSSPHHFITPLPCLISVLEPELHVQPLGVLTSCPAIG